MRELALIDIPEGSRCLAISQEDDGAILLTFKDEAKRVFLCHETGQEEEYPNEGDFAILWKNWQPDKAIVAEVENIISDIYFAGSNEEYDRAVKFRGYEQYRKIKDYGKEVG